MAHATVPLRERRHP